MLITTAATAACSFAAYKLLLNKDAQQAVRGAVDTVRDSYSKINKVVSDIAGITILEDDKTPENAKQTIEQWRELGF